MGTDRGRLRAGLGHVHPTRSQASPTSAPPPGTALPSTWSASSTSPTARTTACRSTTPAHPARAHGRPQPIHGPRLHQLQHPNSDRRPKDRRRVLVSRDSTNGPMTTPMPIAPSSSPKAARPDPQLPASTTSNALVAPARQGGEQLDQREQPQQPRDRQPNPLADPATPRPCAGKAQTLDRQQPPPRPARRLQVAGGRGRHPAADAQAQDEVAATVRLEIADAVRDMEAALAGRELVRVKRGLWARVGFSAAAAVAPYAGAVPTVGAGWGPLLSMTSGIAGHPRHERDPKPGSRRVRLPPSPGQGLS